MGNTRLDESEAGIKIARRQVRWFGTSISKNFSQFVVIHTVKGF